MTTVGQPNQPADTGEMAAGKNNYSKRNKEPKLNINQHDDNDQYQLKMTEILFGKRLNEKHFEFFSSSA